MRFGVKPTRVFYVYISRKNVGVYCEADANLFARSGYNQNSVLGFQVEGV